MPEDDDLLTPQLQRQNLQRGLISGNTEEDETSNQPDYSSTPFAPQQTPNNTTNAVSDYTNYLKQMPVQADYQPSMFRNVLSHIAGIGQGLATHNPQAAAQTVQGIQNRPYQQAMQTWEQNMGAKKDLAQMYSQGVQQQQKAQMDWTKIGQESQKANAALLTAQSRETAEQKYKREMDAIRMKTDAEAKIAAAKIKDPSLIHTYDQQSGKIAFYNPQTGQKVNEDQATPTRPYRDPAVLENLRAQHQFQLEQFRQNAITNRVKNVGKEVTAQSKVLGEQTALQQFAQDPEYKDFIDTVKDKGPLLGKLTVKKPERKTPILGMGGESQQDYNKRLSKFEKFQREVRIAADKISGAGSYDPEDDLDVTGKEVK